MTTDDDNLTPVARACIANARRALAAANGHTPDRRPYVPPVTPAERVQGGVAGAEPGCTCGGMAACLQCQERDADERVQGEGAE